MSNKVPVVFITDSNFIMQTSVAIVSLIENRKSSTVYDIYILASECNAEDVEIIKQIKLEENLLHIISVSVEKYREIKQCAHIPIACLLKFDICDIIQNYDKIIYLDGDIIVRGDLVELYEIELDNEYCAGVLQLSCINDTAKRINAGIMLLNVEKMRKDQISDVLIRTRKQLGDRGSMDQQTYNIVLKDKMKYLSIRYNCIPALLMGSQKRRYCLDEINELYHTDYRSVKKLVSDAVIIHYATEFKPWKYNYTPYANLWYEYYKKTPYKYERLIRINMLSNLYNIVCNNIKKNGVYHGIKIYCETILRKYKRDRIDWG